ASGNRSGVSFQGQRRTYTITGYVTWPSGDGIANRQVACEGGSATSDSNGRFRITGLLSGTYNLVPAAWAEHVFDPASQAVTVNESTGDVGNVPFEARLLTYRIRGTVRAAGGSAIGGVTVSAGGGSTTTQTDGSYVLTGLRAGAYSVSASLSEYEFSPTSRDVTVNQAAGDQSGVDFTGQRLTYTIGGRVVDDAGAGLQGVLVTAGPFSATTDADGDYTIANVPSGTRTVTPQLAEYAFTPGSRSVTVNQTVGDATGVNFVGTRQTYSIQGCVYGDGPNGGQPGVVITADGHTATTDAEAHYVFPALPAGTYLLTPSLAEYNFSPATASIVLDEDHAGAYQEFEAIRKTYSISGRVTNAGGTGIGNVIVMAGGLARSTATDGRYTISGLLAGTYAVQATKAEFTFEPATQDATVNESVGDASGVDFVGTKRTYSISGRVYDASDAAIEGASVRVDDGNGDEVATALTDANGEYSVSGLPAGEYYPSATKISYSFEPAGDWASYWYVWLDETTGDAADVNFIGTLHLYTITGRVTTYDYYENGVPSVTVTGGGKSGVTAQDGSYTLTDLLEGSYTVAVSRDGFEFDPTERSVSVGPYNGTADFKAMRWVFVTKWGSQGGSDGQFLNPAGIAVAPDGSVYVADQGNLRIQQFDANGVFVRKWTCKATDEYGDHEGPYAMAVGPDGSVYASHLSSGRIKRFASDGTLLTAWGGRGNADGLFDRPYGLAVDSGGNVYVADYGNDRVQKFDANGGFVSKWGSAGQGDGRFDSPRDIAVGADGHIWVLDYYNDRLQEFDASGQYLSKFPLGTEDGAYGLAVGPDGHLIVAAGYYDGTQEWQQDGTLFVKLWGWGPGSDEYLYGDRAATDANGVLYAVDGQYTRVVKFRVGGSALTATVRPSALAPAVDARVTALVCSTTGSGGAEIRITLSAAGAVTLGVMNIAGRPIRDIVSDRVLPAGTETLLWDGRSRQGLSVPSGCYLVRAVVRDARGTQSQSLSTLQMRR
ncbi:MAG TPA: carboxypeptidase regulatory-like domain-containing protein, partial [Phycisphaerae bacterium]|nr:carboxypeptidase regulatory-like domain-containing protein [Phycisphaerae bacterium]